MSDIKVGQIERLTQDRVVKFISEKLGYTYLGNREYGREDLPDDDVKNRKTGIEPDLLTANLKKRGYNDDQIKKAIEKIQDIADNKQKSLYDLNQEMYTELRYGVKVKVEAGDQTETVYLIDWGNINNNDFGIAEEVTVTGQHEKRPDVVLYVNGIALGVIEFKRSCIFVSEGIRQNLDNQKEEFIKNFFVTQQLVMAANDTQGLYYGTIETPEKYYMKWDEELKEESNIVDLDKEISQVLNKERFLDIIHNFIIFDGGIKKVCRHNQYFAIKNSQEFLRRREGGIIWHTQGSGKTLTMVWLAKWIRENIDNSRILLITDRDELDKQIEDVFKDAGETEMYRTKNGQDLLNQLSGVDENGKPCKTSPIVGTLIHKFGRQGEGNDFNGYTSIIDATKDFKPSGDIFIFIDECHRTQSGKLHASMKKILPNSVIIGFTGTPLLKADRPSTLIFGKYIHTYKFDQAIKDGVVVDLQYEARKIDQNLTSKDKIDLWFNQKTQGLSPLGSATLKKRWATLQNVLSCKDRLETIAADIQFDFDLKPRLASGRGNAILVAGSIFEACRYYEIFQSMGFTKCAIITSYSPTIDTIKGETTGEEVVSDNAVKYGVYRKMLSNYFKCSEEEATKPAKIEQFEEEVKDTFVKKPAQMKLLIVVDKLLTGFDAPSATYLYIDKPMQDHGLFQAICRVNRIDDKAEEDDLDKDYGYIVDYKDLFKSIEKAVNDYTSEAFDGFEKEDVEGLLKARIKECEKKLDQSIENVDNFVAGVNGSKELSAYIEYFIGDGIDPDSTQMKTLMRVKLYSLISSLNRAYINIANDLPESKYTEEEARTIKGKVEWYNKLKDDLQISAKDKIDLKMYDPMLRNLLDTYIRAGESETISALGDISLVELIAVKGINEGINSLPERIKKDQKAVAATVANNVRKLITDELEVNPTYYKNLSAILDEIIENYKQHTIEYEEYLKQLEELIKKANAQMQGEGYPPEIKVSKGRQALYDALNKDGELAVSIDEAVKESAEDDRRNNSFKKKKVKAKIYELLGETEEAEMVYNLVFNLINEY